MLTDGQEITVHGGSNQYYSGYIGYNEAFGGPSDTPIVNNGLISADVDGTNLYVHGATVVNHGTIEAKNGGIVSVDNLSTNSGTLRSSGTGSLAIGGAWTNTGSIAETNSTINLGGTFTNAGIGAFVPSGGNVHLRGTVNNTGATLTLDPGSDAGAVTSWDLLGGTITGGIVN